MSFFDWQTRNCFAKWLFLLTYTFLIPDSLFARDAEWFSRKMAELKENEKIEDPMLRVERLNRWFGIVAAPAPKDEYEKAIYSAAQKAVVAIPGHAMQAKDKLEIIRARIKSGEAMDPQIYQGAQGGISGLVHLPSAESVAVLGYFLNAPEGRDGRFISGETKTQGDGNRANSVIAMGALHDIGIANPPTGNEKLYWENRWEHVDKWKQWWDEIAAGKRTYRFIGSDVEYGPDGPVSKEKLERIQQNRQRDAERGKAQRKSSGDNTGTESVKDLVQPLPIAGLVSLLLLGTAGWYWLRGRK